MKVLVVDDEPIITQFCAAALCEQGYQVETARDGRQALERVTSFGPNAILLDSKMPDITGFTVAEWLKSDPATTGIPIIMVTCLGRTDDQVKGLIAGADDFLSKPFTREQLLETVNTLIG